MTVPTDGKHRLFFALWPDEELRHAIQRTAAELAGGHVIPVENLHITLIFLGTISEARFAAVLRAGHAAVSPSFEICLDQLATWRRAGIVCLTVTEVPAALRELNEQLRLRLLDEQFELEERPFQPHVTLMRRQTRFICAPIEPLRWRVDEFVLVESRPGARGSEYEILQRWGLSRG